MPETGFTDGDVVTAADLNQIEDQQVTTCTSSTRPTGVEGRMIAETDDNVGRVYDGTTWNILWGFDWVSFTPSWTNLTVGNATQDAWYRYTPAGLAVYGEIVFGSTSSMGSNPLLTLPNSETVRESGDGYASLGVVGLCTMVDDSAGVYYTGRVLYNASTSVRIMADLVNATYGKQTNLSSTVPFGAAWASLDSLSYQFTIAV